MSGLVATLQNDLVALSNEAKRKNPEIKEAAERLLYLLRSLKEKQAMLPPGALDTLTSDLAMTDDTVRPFIMSCETKNPKLIPISINCLQKLISHHAIPESSTAVILKTLSEQAGSTMELQLKILQSILPLTTNYHSVHSETLADALQLCYKLQDTKTPVVNSTAAATFRQLVIHVFEKLSAEDAKIKSAAVEHVSTLDHPIAQNVGEDDDEITNAVLPKLLPTTELSAEYAQYTTDAFMIFQDLCSFASGDPGTYLRIGIMPKGFCLELVESVLTGNPEIFSIHPQLLALLKDRICPMVIKAFSEKNDFSMTVRLMRVLQAIIKNFHLVLVMECEIFLCLYAKLLESEGISIWQRVLVIEAIKNLFSDASMQRSVFEHYDAKEHSTRIFFDILMAISKAIYFERSYLLEGTNGGETARDEVSFSPVSEQYSVTMSTASLKIQCLDQLDKSEPPAFPETYPLFIAIQCILMTVDNIADFVLPVLGTRAISRSDLGSTQYFEALIPPVVTTTAPTEISTEQAVKEEDRQKLTKNSQILMSIEIVKASSPSLLAVLTLLSTSSIDDDIFTWVLQSFQNYTVVVGLLGLTSHRDAFLGAMCKVCVPPSSSARLDFASIAKDVSPFNMAGLHSSTRNPGSTLLSDRNVTCLRILLGISESISAVMDSKTWLIVFETLQIADSLMSSGKMGRRMESSPAFLELGSPATAALAKDSLRHRSTTFSNLLHSGIPFTPISNGSPGGVPGSATNTGNLPASGQAISVDNNFATFSMFVKRVFERTVNMSLEHLQEFVRALCRLSYETMSGSAIVPAGGLALGKDAVKNSDDKSFAVTKLHDVAIANVRRLITSADFGAWDLLVGQLIQMAHTPQCVSSIRNQVCHTFGEILIAAVQMADLSDPVVEMKLLEPIRTIMAVDLALPEPLPAGGVLAPDRGEKSVVLPWLADVQKSGLETLDKLLQVSGQYFAHGWILIFDVLQNMVRLSKTRRSIRGAGASNATVLDASSKAAETTPSSYQQQQQANGEYTPFGVGFGDTPVPMRSPAIVRIGFPCIQLICTDFLALLKPPVLLRCIETVTTFGSLSEDLNISLTSVGLLWTICDFILTKRQELDRYATTTSMNMIVPDLSKSSASVVPSQPPIDSAIPLSESSKAASGEITLEKSTTEFLNQQQLSEEMTTKTLDVLWMYLLGNLSELCSDDRPEVRNSANQTLFRTLAMNGQRLTLAAWDQCIWQILFPLLERIRLSSGAYDAVRGDDKSVDSTTSTSHVRSGQYFLSAHPTPTVMGNGGSVSLPVSTQVQSTTLSPQTLPRFSVPRTTASSKQWDETKVLTLNGVTKCFLDFLHVLVDLGESFDKAWIHILEYITLTCLEGSPEVSMAALKNLRLIIQYARPVATKPIPGNILPRVLTMWLVVWRNWTEIGRGIIEQAEQCCPSHNTSSTPFNTTPDGVNLQNTNVICVVPSLTLPINSTTLPNHNISVVWSDGSSPLLSQGYFTQDTLAMYMSNFAELHSTIRSAFTADDLKQLALISRQLLLYHSMPLPGTSANKIRADFVNDREQLTQLQSAILDIISETKTNFSNIETAVDVLLLLVADILKLPYISTSSFGDSPGTIGSPEMTPSANFTPTLGSSSGATNPTLANSLLKKSTFVALTKRSMQLLVLMFQNHGSTRRSVYSSGAFEMCMEGLQIPMRLKYACPIPGTKDSTPIWRCAASAALTAIGISMRSLDVFFADLDLLRLDSLYNALLSLLEDFLLQSSFPPLTITSDELSADETFDISIVTTIEQDILPHLAQTHVSDVHIVRLLNVLRKGAQLYTSQPNTFPNLRIFMSPLSLPESASGESSVVIDSKHGDDHGKTSTVPPILGFDINSKGRENFAFSCLSVLFSLCGVDPAGNGASERQIRIAELAAPLLMDACKDVLRLYCEDRPTYGQLPMPRLRTAELQFVVQHIRDLKMLPCILQKHYQVDQSDAVRWHVFSGSSAHIFLLYSHLCDALGVVAGAFSGMSNEHDDVGGYTMTESLLVEAIKDSLKCIGQEFTVVPRSAT
ncbi:hypothetical protein BASA50_004633 [Batrachochytrium salamandrivorans]|uniref:Protein MON2 homolog n=1 Tax=Batrachochytrium salamandrivorans TaxID=1357716 RepID=A0ABQ8FI40_9FUNG|nr:hypothetical protein BASA50_004633 [Batrachochytrium salamandrivorans]KAH9268196.1 hypothetical protein BASA84_000391 [Batrachochytrium salamandrivorans]